MRRVQPSNVRTPWSLLAALATCLALLAAACSSSTNGSTSKRLVWFFWVGSPAEAAAWKHNASLVSDKYPNIHVDFTSTSWTNFWQKLPAEASTHSMPCIAGLSADYVASVGNDFMPLNNYIKKYRYDLKPFDRAILRQFAWNGHLLALPYDFGPLVIAYNKDVFKEKSVPLPKNGWTWSSFVHTAKRLTGSGTYGWLPGISNELNYDLTRQPAAYIVDGKFNLTNPAYIAGVRKQAELSYKYKVAPRYSTAPNWATEEFANGKVAMQATGPWSLINFKELSNIHTGWVAFPRGPDGMTHTNVSGSGFGITKDCKNPDAAFKAITQLVSQKAESYLASLGRAFPARLSADSAWKQFAGNKASEVIENALKQAKPEEMTTNWIQFSAAVAQYQALVLSGKITAEEFAKDVQQKAGPGTGISQGDITTLIRGSG